jgi:hypothetical protein
VNPASADAVLLHLLACTTGAEEAPRGPLPQGVYVWQQQWTGAVHRAVAERATPFDASWWLAAEVSWPGGEARIQRVDLPPTAGARLVVRVAVPPPGVDPVPALRELLDELDDGHPAELQLDLDQPTARLATYATWVAALERAVDPTPLTVTTLATWLDAPDDFAALIGAADGYVLQLHWLDLDHPESLLDPAAVAHVSEAASYGAPFRAALPTYRYQLTRGPGGRALGLAAEQGTLSAPRGGDVLDVGADPAEVAALVRALEADAPAELAGLTWFRLPVDGDTAAWSWATLEAVRRGRVPQPSARVEPTLEPGGSTTLTLHNDGDAALRLPALSVGPGVTLADGVNGYRWSGGRFTPPAGSLAPGEARVVGWVRGETSVAVEP